MFKKIKKIYYVCRFMEHCSHDAFIVDMYSSNLWMYSIFLPSGEHF